jgi:TPR repeat protein
MKRKVFNLFLTGVGVLSLLSFFGIEGGETMEIMEINEKAPPCGERKERQESLYLLEHKGLSPSHKLEVIECLEKGKALKEEGKPQQALDYYLSCLREDKLSISHSIIYEASLLGRDLKDSLGGEDRKFLHLKSKEFLRYFSQAHGKGKKRSSLFLKEKELIVENTDKAIVQVFLSLPPVEREKLNIPFVKDKLALLENLRRRSRNGRNGLMDFLQDPGFPSYLPHLLVQFDETMEDTRKKFYLDLAYQMAAQKREEKIVASLHQKARLGGVEDCFNLASYYFQTQKGSNEIKARFWYERAAQQDHVKSLISLGFMCLQGRGGLQDEVEAANLYKRAALKGDAHGYFCLGALYEKGRGVPLNLQEAISNFSKAAFLWHTESKVSLGRILQRQKAYHKAVFWYVEAARQGHPLAHYLLGGMYLQGQGVPQDTYQAARLYELAAEKGEWRGANKLGLLYEEGFKEIEVDFYEASRYYQQAVYLAKPGPFYFVPLLNAAFLYAQGTSNFEEIEPLLRDVSEKEGMEWIHKKRASLSSADFNRREVLSVFERYFRIEEN